MQCHSILRNAPIAVSISNAVLTPEQIHPKFLQSKKSITHVARTFPSQCAEKAMPLTTQEIEFRKKWAQRQITLIQNMPSTAVLGA